MSLFPFDDDRRFYFPVQRYMDRVYDDLMSEFRRSMRTSVMPYWLHQPLLQQCNIGNAVGKVVDDAERFAVEVDVSQFRPEELSVNLREKELVIEGHHEERSDENGRIERHFIRKYVLPDDAQPDTLESHLSDQGVLSVQAKKAAIGAPPTRSIPIKAASREEKK